MNDSGKPAVILLSGGLDSATVLAIARRRGYRCFAMSFDYGQRHRLELEAAKQVAESIGVVRHIVVPIDLRAIGGSALTSDIPIPTDRNETDIAANIPITYVPARNTVFLSLALGWAEVLAASDIFLGVNAVDYSGYPDCRPAFITAFEQLANLATKAGVEGTQYHIHAPLITMTKAEIIKTGINLGLDYGLTHSCYNPDESGQPCRRCDSCHLRAKGFAEAGIADPALETGRGGDGERGVTY